ncbi:MAG: hypothetical protein L3J26_10155 [Candidatus Polarisedimenticolaceae bacterium]|nr:hypothetical protein [Candidatus Polarisedimenticolaceae bacterium]
MTNTPQKIWHSPTLMTWGNLGSRVLGFAVLLPLALSQLTVEEASLWLLFQALLALQGMADFGFTPTFIRIISYARSEKNSSKVKPDAIHLLSINDVLMDRVIGTMRCVYNRLSWVVFLLMAVLGSLMVMKPISLLEDITIGWFAWAVIVVSSVLIFRGGMFGAYMQGVDQIALYQRWQIVTGMISIIGGVIVLLMGSGLFPLVVVMQAGGVAGFFITRKLAAQHAPKASWSGSAIKDQEVMQTIWPAAWRSGLGVVVTYGTIQGTGVIYAQVAPAADAAAFLLAQRVVRTLSSFANAPFYTCIPYMSRMYAEGRLAELVESARTGMLQANWILIGGIIMVGFTAEPLLTFIGSQTPFVSTGVWWVLGLATLIERIGAMHLQLYSTTNHIVWHIVASITGGIMLFTIPVLFQWLGVIGLPLGILMAYTMFFTPYNLSRSYSAFHMNPAHMDGFASMIPIALVLIILIFI